MSTIKERYSHGLCRTMAHFHTALYRILHSGEIDRLRKHAGWQECRNIDRLKKSLEKATYEDLSYWLLMPSLKKCPLLLAEVLTYMISYDELLYTPEELEQMWTPLGLEEFEESENGGEA